MDKIIKNNKSLDYNIFIFVFFFISILFIVSIFPNASSFVVGLFLGTLLLFLISNRMGLFRDIDIPQLESRKNETLAQAVSEISRLIKKTKESVIIVSGGLSEVIWGNEDILNYFNSKKPEHINIKILCGINLAVKKDSELYKFLKNGINNNTLEINITNERPKVHFIIIDDVHVRLEYKHELDAMEREALIEMNDAELARRAKMKYEFYKQNSNKITKSNFSKINFIDKDK